MKKSKDDKALTLILEFSKLSEHEKEAFLTAINQFILSGPQAKRQILSRICAYGETPSLRGGVADSSNKAHDRA